MEFKGITTSAGIFRRCCVDNIKIIYLLRDRDGKLIPEDAELEKFEGGRIEFSYGAKTIFKHTKRIIIEDCFPDRSKFIIKRQRSGKDGVLRPWGQSEREITDISIMRLSDANKETPCIRLKSGNVKPTENTWVYVLTLKPIQ